MKKNKMLRIASAMLVLTLLTTSIIGGTFAKYVTTDSAQDAARVAKFGVVATVAGDLFGSTYKAADENTITAYDVNGGTVSADTAGEKVVAPGTENKAGMTLSIAGTPEVSTQVTLDTAVEGDKAYANSDIYLAKGHYGVMVEYTGVLTADNIGNYYVLTDGKYVEATTVPTDDTKVYELREEINFTDDDYYPLTWYVDGTAVTDQAAVQTAVQNAFADKTFVPNKPVDTAVTVGWEWAFSDVTTGISDQDRKDTILGDMIAQQDGAAVTVVAVTADGVVPVTYETDTTTAANAIVTAKAGDAVVACLTVAFNASITVEQVD